MTEYLNPTHTCGDCPVHRDEQPRQEPERWCIVTAKYRVKFLARADTALKNLDSWREDWPEACLVREDQMAVA